jgi:hypothetical protein
MAAAAVTVAAAAAAAHYCYSLSPSVLFVVVLCVCRVESLFCFFPFMLPSEPVPCGFLHPLLTSSPPHTPIRSLPGHWRKPHPEASRALRLSWQGTQRTVCAVSGQRMRWG